jgi:NAD(P)-dependent dehydrogenase (short-subunit alcohol dehydrogenase family)
MEIKGTSAVITGGASGLGAATARLLASYGVYVTLIDLNDTLGEAVASEVNGAYVRGDVRDEADVIRAVETAIEMAPLSCTVNAAGVGLAVRTVGRDGRFESTHPLDEYRRIIEINLIGTFNVSRLCAAAMSRNEPDEDGCRGAIVNTSSIAAVEGQIGQTAYASSKAGVVGLTLPLARDLAPIGVRVNCILPGLFDTPILGIGQAALDFKEKIGRDVVFPKRAGEPREYASLAHHLLTNSYMNGESIRLDAGNRMQPK